MMYPLAQVALGGALGASLRFLLGTALARPGFPMAVLTANVVGSLAMGALIAWIAHRGGQHWHPFLAVGVLGGFTTFSSFSLETILLIERGAVGQALIYVAASVGASLLALFAGLRLMRWVLA